MNVQIQGGGSGAYANSGSSRGVVDYLQHEDSQRLIEGKEQEHFFTHDRNKVAPSKVANDIDQNKGQLGRNDAKFFVVTVSPSKKEQEALGRTEAERTANFKEYINKDVMQKYAENFNKGLNNTDIKYYAKIHHTRGNKQGEQMHAHIIVSRKDMTNKKKLSPQTTHRNTKKGAVKGGFDRNNFRKSTEQSFDDRFSYKREFKESFEYQNTMKNGNPKDIANLIKEERKHRDKQKNLNVKQEQKSKQNLSLDEKMKRYEELRSKGKQGKCSFAELGERDRLRQELRKEGKIKEQGRGLSM